MRSRAVFDDILCVVICCFIVPFCFAKYVTGLTVNAEKHPIIPNGSRQKYGNKIGAKIKRTMSEQRGIVKNGTFPKLHLCRQRNYLCNVIQSVLMKSVKMS